MIPKETGTESEEPGKGAPASPSTDQERGRSRPRRPRPPPRAPRRRWPEKGRGEGGEEPRGERRSAGGGRSGRPLAEAIQKVNQITHALQEVLKEMEEVLDLLEKAQIQRDNDEQEVEALRRSLDRLDRR